MMSHWHFHQIHPQIQPPAMIPLMMTQSLISIDPAQIDDVALHCGLGLGQTPALPPSDDDPQMLDFQMPQMMKMTMLQLHYWQHHKI